MLEPGTIIKIKSASQINRTLTKDNYCGDIYFNPWMYKYCGCKCSICGYTSAGTYQVKEEGPHNWNWHPEWFDVIDAPNDFLNNGSIEQRSLCLALIRQTISGNRPSLDILTNPKFTGFPNQDRGGFDGIGFISDDWVENKVANNIPDWPCLKLKPEILEKAIKNCLLQHDVNYFTLWVSGPVNAWFVFSGTDEGPEYWFNVKNACSKSNTDKLVINTNKTIENNENRFQKRKGTIVRGSIPKGSKIRSRKCQTSVTVGYLSNRKCIGR